MIKIWALICGAHYGGAGNRPPAHINKGKFDRPTGRRTKLRPGKSGTGMTTTRILTLALIAWMAAAAQSSAETPAAPEARQIASGVWMIPGGFLPKREPDGNTIILAAPKGLIVFDTGRHTWHTQAIKAFAQARRAPIVAIFNSHWHLDHTSGNIALKRAYPAARVYASRAIEAALKGFLPNSAKDDRVYLASGQADPVTAEDVRGDIAVIETPSALIPDVPIEISQTMTVAGRRLGVHLAPHAATAGDVWIYDPKTRTAVVGDLITLPAPFLDTACPAGWETALAAVWATPFETALPGHGPPMSRDQFAAYRQAFQSLIDCASSPSDKQQCAAAWVGGVKPVLDPGPLALRRAQGMTEDYIDLLRMNGGKSPYCTAA